MSTRFKFTALLLGSLGLLAIGSALFTSIGVNKALSEKMEESGQNAVHLASFIVTDKYSNLLYWKVEQVTDLKELLDLLTKIITGVSQETKQNGKDFLKELSRLALPPEMSLWAVTDDLAATKISGDMPEKYNPYRDVDIKGREVGMDMLRLAKNNRTATALVRSEEIPEHNHEYYGTHFYLRDRNLLIGLWTDLESMLAVQDKHFRNAQAWMQERFQLVNIGPSGFLLVSDAKGKIIVHPEIKFEDDALLRINPLTGKTIIEDIRSAAADPDELKPVTVRLNTPKGMRDAKVYSKYNRSFDWYAAGFGFLDEIAAPGRKLSLSLMGLVAAATVVLALGALAYLRRLTAPLASLTRFAKRLPGTDFFKEMEEGERNEVQALVKNHAGDEVGEVAGAFMFMDDALRARVRELVETAGSRERMAGELQAAADIQAGILPKGLDEEKVAGRFSLASRLTPAREVGGDLYDCFFLDEDRLCLAIGDVSEKGVPAALFMSMTTVLIRSAAADAKGPEEIVKWVNDTLSRENPNCMFVTLFVGILDVRSGKMVYANAGHNPPLIRSAEGKVHEVGGLSGPVVGVFPGEEYEAFSLVLEKGELLFMYTDGLTEAMDEDMGQFGEESLYRVLEEVGGMEALKVVEAVEDAVKKHVGAAAASDDLTILCLRTCC